MSAIDRSLKVFMGFIVGISLMLIPVPGIFSSISEVISEVFDIIGFIMFSICGVIICYDAILAIVRKTDKSNF